MVYSSDFSTAPGPAWSSQQRSTSPSGESFLGEFVNEGVTLTLINLPDHERATVTFDLYIIRSWDGNQVDFPWLAAAYAALDTATLGSIGPDRWLLQTGGVTLVDTTFANIVEFRQSYPGSYPGGDSPAQNGALAVNSLFSARLCAIHKTCQYYTTGRPISIAKNVGQQASRPLLPFVQRRARGELG